VVVHFPVAGSFFALAALGIAVTRPRARAASLVAAGLLQAASFAGGLAAAVTGWLWADQLAYLAGGWGFIPGPKAVEGLARQHALLAVAFVLSAGLALAMTLAARRHDRPPVPALLAAALACGLVAAAGHLGGTMVHAPPPPQDEAGSPPSR
jgi:hypothetical protein